MQNLLRNFLINAFHLYINGQIGDEGKVGNAFSYTFETVHSVVAFNLEGKLVDGSGSTIILPRHSWLMHGVVLQPFFENVSTLITCDEEEEVIPA